MCSVIKNVNKAVLIQTFMSDVIHCFAFDNKKIFVLSIEFYKILRRKLKATNMGRKKKKKKDHFYLTDMTTNIIYKQNNRE